MTSDSNSDRPAPKEPAASHPNQPGSDEADRSREATPAGIADDLEEKAEDTGASTDPPD